MCGLGFEIAIGMGRGRVMEVSKSPSENLLDRAFDLVKLTVRREVRSHVAYLNQKHGNKLTLDDRDESFGSLARLDDTSQVLLVKYDSLQRHVSFEKTKDPTVNYLIRAIGLADNEPKMTHRKYGNELGELSATELVDVVRNVVETAMGMRQVQ
jgi:hypothetical protein